MNAAAIDLGTNSMRLLIVDAEGRTVVRETHVTGLGTGVDATGRFASERVKATLAVVDRFAALMNQHAVGPCVAVATSASRDADNGGQFIREVQARIGAAPEIISGDREGRLAFQGAISGRPGGPFIVIDIGGGSTEFIRGTTDVQAAISIDIGSVRLTDRKLPDSPPDERQLAAAREHVADLLDVPFDAEGATVLGVAGTFFTIAAALFEVETYDRDVVAGKSMTLDDIDRFVDRVSVLTVDAIADLPGIHPDRAPAILGGAIVASGALRAIGAQAATISESGLLDALAREALGQLGPATGDSSTNKELHSS